MPQPALLFSCFSVDATHLVGICKVHTCNKKTFFSIHQWVQARQFLYTYLLYILIFCIRVNYQVDHLFHSNVSGGSPTNFRSQLNHHFAFTLPAVNFQILHGRKRWHVTTQLAICWLRQTHQLTVIYVYVGVRLTIWATPFKPPCSLHAPILLY